MSNAVGEQEPLNGQIGRSDRIAITYLGVIQALLGEIDQAKLRAQGEEPASAAPCHVTQRVFGRQVLARDQNSLLEVPFVGRRPGSPRAGAGRAEARRA
ncbi:MAG: hypothetical protein IPO15_04810 [Anaerolineae bacterium]|nr:hypothetical protein [Anaerolineae bacterium]